MVYPRRCFACQAILKQEGQYLCRDCQKKVRLIGEPSCMRCGRPLNKEETEYCTQCRGRDYAFVRAVAAFPYRGAMRGSIRRMKFQNRREYLDGYAWYMARQVRPHLESWQIDRVCPIPLHWARRRRRGFDQAALLAEKLGALLDIPADTKTLARVRHTRAQKRLPGDERRRNVENAFACRGDGLAGRRVLLVDDVFTTGATANSAAGALLEGGAAAVYVAAVCVVGGAYREKNGPGKRKKVE